MAISPAKFLLGLPPFHKPPGISVDIQEPDHTVLLWFISKTAPWFCSNHSHLLLHDSCVLGSVLFPNTDLWCGWAHSEQQLARWEGDIMRDSPEEEVQFGGKEINSSLTLWTLGYLTQNTHCTDENTEALPLIGRLEELITSGGCDAWEHTPYQNDTLKWPKWARYFGNVQVCVASGIVICVLHCFLCLAVWATGLPLS